MTLSGNYSVSAYDANGNNLMGKLNLTTNGRGIYSIRNGICSLHPNATVIFKDSSTGEELKPYQCPNRTSKNTTNNFSNHSDISPTTQLKLKSDNPSAPSDTSNQQRRRSFDSAGQDLESDNNGSSKSRLRLFGQNGATAIFYRNSKCVKPSLGKEDERVSGGFSSAFSSLLGTVSNTSIGMPETDTTRNLSKSDGLLSRAYFREYEIAGNEPVTVKIGFQDVANSGTNCKRSAYFLPRPGKDYEASISWGKGVCDIFMKQISQKEGITTTTLKPVDTFKAYACEDE